MTDHAAAAQDRALLMAPDEYEDMRYELERLHAAMGVCAVMGHWTSFYLLLPDAAALSKKLDGGNDEATTG